MNSETSVIAVHDFKEKEPKLTDKMTTILGNDNDGSFVEERQPVLCFNTIIL